MTHFLCMREKRPSFFFGSASPPFFFLALGAFINDVRIHKRIKSSKEFQQGRRAEGSQIQKHLRTAFVQCPLLFFGGGANAADPGLLMVLVVDSAVDALELPADLTELAVELGLDCVFRFSFT